MLASRTFLLSSFAAFVGANLIHNGGGLDPAVVPAGVLIGLATWKRWPVAAVLAAICVAAPALGFFKPNAILQPTTMLRLFNHVFLLAAGVLALVAAVLEIRGVLRKRNG